MTGIRQHCSSDKKKIYHAEVNLWKLRAFMDDSPIIDNAMSLIGLLEFLRLLDVDRIKIKSYNHQ